MYYQPEIETIKRSELQKLQVKRLKRSIDIALHSPFMLNFRRKGITSDSISIVEDIRKLPFTTKADLRGILSFRTGCYRYEKMSYDCTLQVERPVIRLLYVIHNMISTNGLTE